MSTVYVCNWTFVSAA